MRVVFRVRLGRAAYACGQAPKAQVHQGREASYREAEAPPQQEPVRYALVLCRRLQQSIRPTAVYCSRCWIFVPAKQKDALIAAYAPGVPAAANTGQEWFAAIKACNEAIKTTREYGFVDGKPVSADLLDEDSGESNGAAPQRLD